MSDKMREAFEENIPFGFSAKNSDGEYIDHETSVWFDEFSRGWEAALSQQPEHPTEDRPPEPRCEDEDPEQWCRVLKWEEERGDYWEAVAKSQQPESESVGYISKEYLDALAGETKHLCSTISAEPRHNSSIDYVIPVFTSHRPSAQVPNGFNRLAYNRKTDEWLYINHAGEWQLCPCPVPQAAHVPDRLPPSMAEKENNNE